jgi:hypothetical protein
MVATLAQDFAKTGSHPEALQDMYAKNFKYTHFAGLFQTVAPRSRSQYGDLCGREHTAPVDRCAACGNTLIDVFGPQPLATAGTEATTEPTEAA